MEEKGNLSLQLVHVIHVMPIIIIVDILYLYELCILNQKYDNNNIIIENSYYDAGGACADEAGGPWPSRQ